MALHDIRYVCLIQLKAGQKGEGPCIDTGLHRTKYVKRLVDRLAFLFCFLVVHYLLGKLKHVDLSAREIIFSGNDL